MSSFTTPLQLSYNDNDAERPFVVDEDFVYWTNLWPQAPIMNEERIEIGETGQCVISVEAGYATDFASIPRLVWNIFPPHHPHYAKAAVVHDYLYSYGIGDKGWADNVFLEAMTILGCPGWKRWVFYTAVRVGGRGAYG
jgi:hypothetical protein